MINILHYYCKPNKKELLNNITYRHGVSCQVNDTFLDISDIVKDLTNKNHIDCIVIDDGLFSQFDTPEDIKSKLDVLRYVCVDTEIVIVALDKDDDETLELLSRSKVTELIITKSMKDDFESIMADYLDGKYSEREEETIVENTMPEQVEPEKQPTQKVEVIKEEPETQKTNSSFSAIVTSSIRKEPQESVQKDEDVIIDIVDTEMETEDVFANFETDDVITIGVCGLQPHIGVTHHALSLAKSLSALSKDTRVCYKENNAHDAYRVLQASSLASVKQGFINIMGVDIYDRYANVNNLEDYEICVIDFGSIQECKSSDFFETDIPIIIAGAKDWEIHNFIGAYKNGILDNATVLMNFFPENEQTNFKKAFPDLKLYFADYAPEVFAPDNNIDLYFDILRENLIRLENVE